MRLSIADRDSSNSASSASLVKLLLAAILAVTLQACSSNLTTEVDVSEAAFATDDATLVSPKFKHKISIGSLHVDSPKKGDRMVLLGMKETGRIYGTPYTTGTTNNFILEQDSEPLFVSALTHVFEEEPGNDRVVRVVPQYSFKPEQDQNFWHSWIVLAAHLKLHVVVEENGQVLYDRQVAAGAQEDYSLLAQLYPSSRMIRRLMMETLRKAVRRLSEDQQFLALSEAGTV